ncbi:hypothetical protein U0070_000563, partial [Myodes glareolus]
PPDTRRPRCEEEQRGSEKIRAPPGLTVVGSEAKPPGWACAAIGAQCNCAFPRFPCPAQLLIPHIYSKAEPETSRGGAGEKEYPETRNEEETGFIKQLVPNYTTKGKRRKNNPDTLTASLKEC